jgi:hypothetical protein
MTKDKVVIKLKGGKLLSLNFTALGDEMEVDELLQIDVQNLIAEMVTFPAIMNKISIMLAESNNEMAEAEVSLRIWQAQAREQIRNEAVMVGEKMTEQKIEDKMRVKPQYKALKSSFFQKQKYHDVLNSLFWSMKSKDDKLNKLSLTIQDGDIAETLISSRLDHFNGVKLKISEPLIK